MSKKEDILHTPKGRFEWAKLLEPDKKFKAEGEYSVDVFFKEEEVENIIDLIKDAIKKRKEEEEKSGKKKTKLAPMPMEKIEGGEIRLRFKQAAEVKSKTGEIFNYTIPVYDNLNNDWNPDVKIGNGSIGKIAFSIHSWAVGSLGVGATLRLRAAQVIEHVTYDSRNASDFGFDEEEGEAHDSNERDINFENEPTATTTVGETGDDIPF